MVTKFAEPPDSLFLRRSDESATIARLEKHANTTTSARMTMPADTPPRGWMRRVSPSRTPLRPLLRTLLEPR